jgi:hypothetical protein
MAKLRALLTKTLITCAALAGVVFAQSNLTQIQDANVRKPDGTLFSGTVILTWNGSPGTSSGTVAPLSTSARIYNGVLSVLLVPTTTAAVGTYYQAVYNSNDGTVSWSEAWQVPPSSTPLTISQVRTSTGTGSGTGGGTGITGTVTMNQVVGLNAYLTQVSNLITTLTNTTNTLTTSVATLNTSVQTLQAGTNGSSSMAAFTDGEAPTGAINSTNATFTLSNTPSPTLSLQLYRNGVLQTYGVDYSVNGSQITLVAGDIPSTGDSLIAYYRVAGTGPQATFVDLEVPSGTINGTNKVFTLAFAPNPQLSLRVSNNGILLKQGADYTLSGSTVTFVTAAVPQTGDLLTASYRH